MRLRENGVEVDGVGVPMKRTMAPSGWIPWGRKRVRRSPGLEVMLTFEQNDDALKGGSNIELTDDPATTHM